MNTMNASLMSWQYVALVLLSVVVPGGIVSWFCLRKMLPKQEPGTVRGPTSADLARLEMSDEHFPVEGQGMADYFIESAMEEAATKKDKGRLCHAHDACKERIRTFAAMLEQCQAFAEETVRRSDPSIRTADLFRAVAVEFVRNLPLRPEDDAKE